jgi:hypothetical protein
VLALPLAFHPAAALIRRKIRETREQACDELAAAVLGAKGYARALVALGRSVESGAAGGVCRRHVRPFFRGACHEALGFTVVPGRSAERRPPGRERTGPGPGRGHGFGGHGRRRRAGGVRALFRRCRGRRRAGATRRRASRVRAEYVYAAGAKRDPFMDLRVHSDKPTNVHDPRAFLIQEVALRGVVRGPKGWTAMVLGPDGRTYFVSAGQAFYDATLTAVDVGGMTVQQQVRDPLAPARVRDLRIALHADRD